MCGLKRFNCLSIDLWEEKELCFSSLNGWGNSIEEKISFPNQNINGQSSVFWRRNTPSKKASSIEIHSLLSELIFKKEEKICSLGRSLQSRHERKKWDGENQPGENWNCHNEWWTIYYWELCGKANVHVSIHLYISLSMIKYSERNERKMTLMIEMLCLVFIFTWFK